MSDAHRRSSSVSLPLTSTSRQQQQPRSTNPKSRPFPKPKPTALQSPAGSKHLRFSSLSELQTSSDDEGSVHDVATPEEASVAAALITENDSALAVPMSALVIRSKQVHQPLTENHSDDITLVDSANSHVVSQPQRVTNTPAVKGKSEVLYRLECNDGNQKIFRYSWEPFEGLWSSRDESTQKAREELAVLDVLDSISGILNIRRRSQLRENFEKEDAAAPFVVGRDFISRSYSETALRICSSQLQSLIRDVILYYPGSSILEDNKSSYGNLEMFLYDSFQPVFHYWDTFHELVSKFKTGFNEVKIKESETVVSVDEVKCAHLEILLDCKPVQKIYQEVILPERELHKAKKASFDNLWLLYRPGEIVFAKVEGILVGYVVMQVEKRNTAALPDPADTLKISLWNLAYDDEKLTRQPRVIRMSRFKGQKNITDLDVFPTSFGSPDEKNDLIKRGEQYYSIIKDPQRYMRYNGLIEGSDKTYQYDGEIIIDHNGYKVEVKRAWGESSPVEPADFGGYPLFSKFDKMSCSHQETLRPDEYLLLPSHVYGFSMSDKRWCKFDMACVSEIPEEPKPIMDNLIIDSASKELILAAAGKPRDSNHAALSAWSTSWSADFVEGKGRGKVIFLHGSPGTGKTMTVECVARHTRRPLISLSVADLGTEEVRLERKLFEWLGRAASWGAIVLIDECEVYMEQRERGELSRNALVAAFLRTLEYFPGLIFLTSNAIGLIDEAVRSRIHIAIRYERPDVEQRKFIWDKLFQKLVDDQKPKKIRHFRAPKTAADGPLEANPKIEFEQTAKELAYGVVDKTYAELPLNGRDMRNILLFAIDVAKLRQRTANGGVAPNTVVVNTVDLKSVFQNKMKFEQDTQAVDGFDADSKAQEKGLRASQ